MRIIPAIDLANGRCVRLFQGDFEQVTEYDSDPLAVLRRFDALDVDEVHIVDLDGARTGRQSNRDAVRRIVENARVSIQLGGGIRDTAVLERWLSGGVLRCVLGSIAIEKPALVKGWIAEFGADRIVLALDIDSRVGASPAIATKGWTETSDTPLWDCLDDFRDAGLMHVLCTDISRDGAMAGPNLDLYRSIVSRYPGIQLQASGGVRGIDDLRDLRSAGIPAAITGTALLQGRLTADEVASFRSDA